jgi:small-conductance mechanosensitive channel
MNALLQEIKSSFLHLIGRSVEALPAVIVALAILFLTRYAANMTRRTATVALKRMTNSQSLQSLLVQMSYVAVWVGGILLASVIAFPGLQITDIIELLGLSSVAIGFVFQDIFKNFLAGVLLLLNEPFRVGEQVIVDGFEGTIEEISLRSTQIRTYQGELVVIPNAIVFTSPVQVLTAMSHHRTDFALGVDYNTDLPSAIQTLLKTVTRVEGVLSSPPPEIDAVGFGDTSVELMVRYWTLPQRVQVRQTQTRLLIALTQACEQADIFISYPIRTLYDDNQQHERDHFFTSTTEEPIGECETDEENYLG